MEHIKWLSKHLRALITPEEILLAEQFAYGHREIPLTHLQLPLYLLLLGELQYGFATHHSEIPQSRNRFRNRLGSHDPLYVRSELLRTRLVEQCGYKDVHAIGSPWTHYVSRKELLKTQENIENAYVVYFPATHFMEQEELRDCQST